MRQSLFKSFVLLVIAIASVTVYAKSAAIGDGENQTDPTLDVRPLQRADVPDPLKSWVPWVLKDQPQLACPFAYNAVEDRRCVWPGKIALVLNAKGGSFSYQAQVFAAAQVALPGNAQTWPQGVLVNGKPAQVTGASPRVALPIGSHTITGTFIWSALPESLALPDGIGLVDLNMSGKSVGLPNVNENGQLWLAQEANEEERETTSQLTVKVNRLIEDLIPARVTTQLELIASGKNQEVVLPNVVPNGFIPIDLKSGLPARVEADGKLRVQVRAGRWLITLVARNQAPLMNLPAPASLATAAMAPPIPESLTKRVAIVEPLTPGATLKNVVLPTEEVWAFQAHNELRLVTLEGLTAVDPQQTTLPNEWRRFPAFMVRANDTLKFNETKRGDPQPAPDRLALKRNIWLDFDGRGYTVQDNISGVMNHSWRLEMAAPAVLGRAAVAGVDQFITTLADPKAGGTKAMVGIEVRRGQANVIADSRIETSDKTLSAVGWLKDFNALSATLHLPPGWRLIATQGADSSRSAWVTQWTLLDLFLLLIVGISFGRLFGAKWGVIAVIAVALSYHEAGLPIAPWLVALAFIALTRLLPKESKFAKWMQAGRVLALLVVALTLLPFMIAQVRMAMYPVLEKQYQAVFPGDGTGGSGSMMTRMRRPEAQDAMVAITEAAQAGAAGAAESQIAEMAAPEVSNTLTRKYAPPAPAAKVAAPETPPPSLKNIYAQKNAQFRDNFDSKAMIQTGPGLPGWTWNSHPISWSGPVEQGQQLSLWLVSPFWSAVLRILSVLLLGAMFLCMLELIKRWPGGLTPKQSGEIDFSAFKFGKWRAGKSMSATTSPPPTVTSAKAASAIATLVLALSAFTPSPNASAAIPTPELLEQLRARLTIPPSCLPQCAAIPRMAVSASGDAIALRLEIHATEDVAVPLPGGAKAWRAQQVLLNGKPAGGLARDREGTLWVQVPRGVQQVQLIGNSGDLDVIAFTLPLKPNRVVSELTGWTLDGVNDNAQPDNSLTLSRVAGTKKRAVTGAGEGAQGAQGAALGSIAPFFLVERTLLIGLQWQVTTRVVRLSPSNAPASLEVMLLDGESITTPEPRTEKGKALVSMAPQTTEVVWESTLKEAPEINLVASKQSNQFEVWQLSPGTQWHFALAGIAVTAHQEDSRWSPKWQPWPGEGVKIGITKPAGVAGQTLTVDGTLVTVKPGTRATDSSLMTTLRSSRGGQHVIQLPEGAALQSVAINGQAQPIRLEGRELRLPLVPGSQKVDIGWREPTGLSTRFVTPQVNMNAPSVNARVVLAMPTERWTLFVGGSRIGPAVLIWGVLVVLIALAYGLGRVPLTPLRMLQWSLLAVGFTQVHPLAGAIFVGWLFVLGLRKSRGATLSNGWFNLGQVVLAGWTLVALAILVWSVSQGLLGSPNMQITGNGSTAESLSWFADRADALLPTAWVVSVPLWLYRGFMLLWALWLAYALLQWLKWGWSCFTEGGYWRASEKKVKDEKVASGAKAAAANQAEAKGGGAPKQGA